MKQYEKYKDSGVTWLGEIPEHWKSIPFKHCVDINNGRDYKHIISDKGYPVYGSGGVFAQVSEFLYDGEVILLGRKGTIDKPLHYCGKLWAVDTMFYAIPNALSCGRYFYYQALGFPFDLYSTSTALPSMTQTDLNNHIVSVPTYSEQRKIAEYLDYTVGRVDEIVSGKQVQIDRLMDYRKAMINEVVTKGLNPDAPMRDSGIEWLGEIPAHWGMSKVKYELDNLNYLRKPLNSSERYEKKGEYDYYGASGVIDKVDEYLFDGEYILIGEDGANILSRSTPLAFIARGQFWVNNHAHILSPKKGNIDYLCHRLECLDYSIYASGSAQPKLTAEALANIVISIPDSIEEQTEIVTYIEERTIKIDKIVKELTSQIEKLKEYKTSIISEAVTGKIDLREWEESNNN